MNTVTTNPLVVLSEFLKTNESRFISIVYTNKNNETSKYLLHTNINLRNVYERDLSVMKSFKERTELEFVCKNEIIDSIQKSLDTNFNNPEYTKKDYYTYLSKGVKFHENDLYFNCFVIKKETIIKGVYKTVKSAEKTLVKNGLKKMLKMNKFREFRLDMTQLHNIKMNKNVIEIE